MENIFVNIFTIIIGLIIGIISGFFLFKKNIYKGLNADSVTKKIFNDLDGKKFKWTPEICICPTYLSMNKLKNKDYIYPGH